MRFEQNMLADQPLEYIFKQHISFVFFLFKLFELYGVFINNQTNYAFHIYNYAKKYFNHAKYTLVLYTNIDFLNQYIKLIIKFQVKYHIWIKNTGLH